MKPSDGNSRLKSVQFCGCFVHRILSCLDVLAIISDHLQLSLLTLDNISCILGSTAPLVLQMLQSVPILSNSPSQLREQCYLGQGSLSALLYAAGKSETHKG